MKISRLHNLCAGLMGGLVLTATAMGSAAAGSLLQTDNLPRLEVPENMAQVRMSFSPIVEKTAPAVVTVYTRRIVEGRARSPFEADPFFRQFYGAGGGAIRPQEQRALGSGVIVRPDGVIVTNNHVVEGMSEIKVMLSDRREYEAELVLTDPRTDLAVLRIKADEPLPFLNFTNSDKASVGDIVLAIGNPFGVGQTVTSGIVSALARTQVGISDFQFFIQTDAAINPGNSGGALVDIEGRLLGINSAIYSRSGGSNGIGFAIPGNLVRQVVATAIDGDGSLVRPWLGASAETISSQMAHALSLPKTAGALLQDIFPGSPADRAGLKPGDVITSLGQFDIYDAEAMRFRIGTRAPGEKLPVRYFRDGKERQGILILALPPEKPARNTTRLKGNQPLAGARVANLSPAVNEELGRTPLDEGVVVLDVDPNTLAQRYGLRKGTRILAVNGARIHSVADLQAVLQAPTRGWTVKTEDPSGRISNWRIGW